MIVIATIGVLASIGIPSLQKYVYRSKRNEAYLNLNGIFKSQSTFHAENGHYGTTFDEIGFEILGARQIDPNTIESEFYTYTLEAFAVDGVANANYSAVATGDLDPSDAMLDVVMIESGLIIKN
jgi:Tfp pilus assembly protein PilE